MTTLVVGATGATGRLLVRQLLDRGEAVRAVVRSPERMPEAVRQHDRLSLIQARVLELSDAEMAGHVEGCAAVASCLGHNMTWKGLFGHPRRLVTDAVGRLCRAIETNKPRQPVRFVLMNSAGIRNRDLDERVSIGHKLVAGLLRLLIPPYVDNERAPECLRTGVGRDNPSVQWVAVRPDSLIDEDQVTEYELCASPTRDPLFNPGQTSRINVAHFMADLMTDDAVWNQWKGQMPVIYNKESAS